MNKAFFKGTLKCVTPIAIGSGKSDFTDNDLLYDCNGVPFIPGTTLAGVSRHYLENCGFKTNDLFGFISLEPEKKNGEVYYPREESRIIFYESFLSGSFIKNFRDGVAITEDGVAADGAKFDYEIVEAGCKFDFKIEIDNFVEIDKKMISCLLDGLNKGFVRLGHNSNRGLGKVEVEELKFKKISNIDELVSFDWSQVNDDFNLTEISSDYIEKSYKFNVKSFVMIADNATLEKKDDKLINAEMLKNADGKSVVPGTSWAGVFRNHFNKILTLVGYENKTAFLNKLFGSTEQASKIVFDESVIEDATRIQQTRNAIDRFTGGASDKKLFTNMLSFGGNVEFKIHIKANSDKNLLTEDEMKLSESLIAQTIADLNDGYLNIGGLGSVGGGLLTQVKEGDTNA